MLSTGDIRDWDAVVDQVLRCLVLKAPVDRRQLELHTLRDIEPMQFFVLYSINIEGSFFRIFRLKHITGIYSCQRWVWQSRLSLNCVLLVFRQRKVDATLSLLSPTNSRLTSDRQEVCWLCAFIITRDYLPSLLLSFQLVSRSLLAGWLNPKHRWLQCLRFY